MGAGLLRFVGGLVGLLYRFLAYTFLRWIPGRHGTYLVPAFFFANLACHLLNNQHSTTPVAPPPAERALVPDTPDAPTYAQVTALHTENEDLALVPATAPASGNGNGALRRRKKKSGSSSAANSTASDSEPPSPTSLTSRKLARAGHRSPKSTTSLRQILSSLLLSAPSPSRFLNIATVLLNVVLLAACLDALWSPILGMDGASLAFVRVGAVDYHSVKISARIPPESSLVHQSDTGAGNTTGGEEAFLPVDEFQGARIVYRPTKPLGKWIAGGELHVEEAKDWVGVLKIDGLWAQTEYECAFSRQPASHFTAHSLRLLRRPTSLALHLSSTPPRLPFHSHLYHFP
jgi:alkaline phosphatase D